jgi:outer membrane protein OmpA-like peptidoglycan-associated protein
MSRIALFVTLVSVAACGHQASVKLGVSVEKKPTKKVAKKEEPRQVAPNLNMTNDLVEQCMVKITSTANIPRFEYDQFELEKEDRDVLDSIGRCVMQDGPLAGRALQLIGRADPRGTTEYNLALGDKRALQVSAYLVRMGVARDQISTVTRGDLEASGKDETGWRNDRRVDVTLMEDIKTVSTR